MFFPCGIHYGLIELFPTLSAADDLSLTCAQDKTMVDPINDLAACGVRSGVPSTISLLKGRLLRRPVTI